MIISHSDCHTIRKLTPNAVSSNLPGNVQGPSDNLSDGDPLTFWERYEGNELYKLSIQNVFVCLEVLCYHNF